MAINRRGFDSPAPSMDKNVVFLEGVIASGYKECAANNGRRYITFVLGVGQPILSELADSTERDHYEANLRIFVYDFRLVKYLRDVGAKEGDRVSLFARLTSFKTYVGEKLVWSVCVVARDVRLLK